MINTNKKPETFVSGLSCGERGIYSIFLQYTFIILVYYANSSSTLSGNIIDKITEISNTPPITINETTDSIW
jgi:hypothetical protein